MRPSKPDKLNSNQSSIVAARPVTESLIASDCHEFNPSDLILSSPYQLSERAAQFRQLYAQFVGRTVCTDGIKRLGLNAANIRQSIDSLGFERISEDAALATPPDVYKLNLAITIAKNIPTLSGPGYMIMRPFVRAMDQMCSKWRLVASMRRLEDAMRLEGSAFLTGSGGLFTHEEFTAFTVNLNDSRLEEILTRRPGTYLAKPARASMGQGLQLVSIRSDRVKQDLLQFLRSSKFRSMHRAQVILQRYIDSPLLIDKRKFDMRVYHLVVNPKRQPTGGSGDEDKSGYFAFYHPGFVRLCTAAYDPADSDLAVHLTNQSIQAKHTRTFAQLKEVTTWYPDELNRYLNRRRRQGIRRNWARDVMYPKVGAILGYISALYRTHMQDRDFPADTFRILGVDFLVDSQLRVHLLEFNELPAWGRQTSVLQDVKPNLWLEAACLVSEVAIRYRGRQPIADQLLVTRQNFRLVYSSEDPDLTRRQIAGLYPATTSLVQH